MADHKTTPVFVPIQVQDVSNDPKEKKGVNNKLKYGILSKLETQIFYVWTVLPLMSSFGVILSTVFYYGLWLEDDWDIMDDGEMTPIAICGLAVVGTTVLALTVFSCGMLNRAKSCTTDWGWLILIIMSAVSDILFQSCMAYMFLTLDPCLERTFTWGLLTILFGFVVIHVILSLPVYRLAKKVSRIRTQMTFSRRTKRNPGNGGQEEETFYWTSGVRSMTQNNDDDDDAPIILLADDVGSKVSHF